jgi:hypothetical protein
VNRQEDFQEVHFVLLSGIAGLMFEQDLASHLGGTSSQKLPSGFLRALHVFY